MSFEMIKTGLVALALALLTACGGGGGSAGTPVVPGTGSGGGSGGSGSGGTSGGPTVALAVSSTVVTAASPATVTVTVRDALGVPVSGTVVDLTTVRGTLATLAVNSVATDASGSARVALSAAAGGLSGADEVVAVAKLGTTTVQGSVSFSVTGSVPTVGLTMSVYTLRASTGPATLRAVVKNAAGAVVPNVQVSFASAAGRVKLGAASAMSDGFGTASTSVANADPTLTAAETITASATVGTTPVQVQSAVVVQLLADTPSIALSRIAPSSVATAASPVSVQLLVKDASATPVGAGTVVSAVSSFGLSAFDAATAVTDSTGVATFVVTPKSPTSNGADQLVFSATVGGVAVSTGVVVQISSLSSTAPPVLQTSLSSTSISAASPATVTATLTDGKGQPVAGQVVAFTVVRGLAKTSIPTALTDAAGKAVVVLSPTSSSTAGADEVVATASLAGTTLQSSKGFQIQATNVTLSAFTSAVPSLGAYGQTTLTITIVGASVGSPVNVAVTSSCVSLGKATVSPLTFTATSASVDLQYKDGGCGAVQAEDKLQASIVGAASSVQLTLPIAVPSASSLAFISAVPEVIYIKGSGFTETSTLTFEVRDGAGNTLPNRSVVLSLLTRSGGVTMEGGTADVTQVSDAAGRVSVRVNSGTVPTPVRVSATLGGNTSIATVSSNLSVAVGLPSQLNFSLSQTSRNIEGFNIDGTVNAYNVIASDRNGNPVPAGTSINFVTEGGQVEPIKQIQLALGLARASAQFVSADPRPEDGRITVTAYALGEESFIDQNGNNVYDAGEPFQDLGNVFKDRLFDGAYDASVDEYIPTNIANTSSCLSPGNSAPPFNPATQKGVTSSTNALLALDASIPSMGASTCDGIWSGAGKVYVRRATETVLSTSAARPLWANVSGLGASCPKITLQIGPSTSTVAIFAPVSGETYYLGGRDGVLSFIVGDANSYAPGSPSRAGGAVGRLNPMAAGTTVTASTPTTGVKLTVGGSPVGNTTEATGAVVGVSFGLEAPSSGVVFVTFTSPSGLGTTLGINVNVGARGAFGVCAP